MEYCCDMFKIQEDVRLKQIKTTEDGDGKHWYAKCPFCKSVLIVSEDGVIVHTLTCEPREFQRINRVHDQEEKEWKEINRLKQTKK